MLPYSGVVGWGICPRDVFVEWTIKELLAAYPRPRDVEGYGLIGDDERQSSSAPQIAKALAEMYAAAPPSDVTATI